MPCQGAVSDREQILLFLPSSGKKNVRFSRGSSWGAFERYLGLFRPDRGFLRWMGLGPPAWRGRMDGPLPCIIAATCHSCHRNAAHAYRPSTGAPLVTARVKREQRNFAGTRGSARAVTSATCRPSNQSSVLCIGGFRRRRSLSDIPACPCH